MKTRFADGTEGREFRARKEKSATRKKPTVSATALIAALEPLASHYASYRPDTRRIAVDAETQWPRVESMADDKTESRITRGTDGVPRFAGFELYPVRT